MKSFTTTFFLSQFRHTIPTPCTHAWKCYTIQQQYRAEGGTAGWNARGRLPTVNFRPGSYPLHLFFLDPARRIDFIVVSLGLRFLAGV